MSDIHDGGTGAPADGEAGEPQGTPDPIQGVKAEMNRKLTNMSDVIAQQNKNFESVLAMLQESRQPAAQPAKPLKDLVFEDPEAFVRQVVSHAERAANQQIDQRVQVSTATQGIITDMQVRYPEFAAPNSEAAILAIQKASQQSKNLQGTPEGARLAMMDAVAELGLVPASKRQNTRQNADDFVAPGSAGGSARQRANDPKKGIDPNTLALAEAMGVDINDPKRLEGLAAASKRPNWNKYT